MLAALGAHTECVRLLLEGGADSNATCSVRHLMPILFHRFWSGIMVNETSGLFDAYPDASEFEFVLY
jgi:hypothetical protein